MVQASRGARAEDGDDLYQEHQHQAGGVHHVILADIEALDDGQRTQAAAADGAGQCRIAQNGGDADSVEGWKFYATSIQLNPCSVTTAYGNMYVSQEYNFAYGPATGTPYVTATCQSNGYAYAHISYSTNQNRVYFRVINPVQTSSLNVVVHFHIMWKNE